MSAAILDLDHLRRYTGGDPALERELFELFLPNAQRYLGILRAPESDDAFARAAHSLKGAASGIGAWAVAERAERAEALTGQDRDARQDARRACLDDLERAIAAVATIIATYQQAD